MFSHFSRKLNGIYEEASLKTFQKRTTFTAYHLKFLFTAMVLIISCTEIYFLQHTSLINSYSMYGTNCI